MEFSENGPGYPETNRFPIFYPKFPRHEAACRGVEGIIAMYSD
jgi:hypothetical protein